MIKEHPISFKAEMVRAILDESKTKTRRVCKPQPGFVPIEHDFAGQQTFLSPNQIVEYKCKYGQPGDRLWVKETHARIEGNICAATHYMADNPLPSMDVRHDAGLLRVYPSIYMPRQSSRIDLEITAVRVERLQDISEEDAIAEGAHGLDWGYGPCHKAGFNQIWDSINPAEIPLLDDDGRKIGMELNPARWDANPFVWVISFKRIKP